MPPDPSHISIHDNTLYAYSVDCENRRLLLHTKFCLHQICEYTDVLFTQVVAHHFQDALPGNILFDIKESDLAALIHDNAALFTDGQRYGWPIDYKGNLNTLIAELTKTNTRAFVVFSTLGLSGWVLAQTCQRLPRNQLATFT
jgi:hypothetical protein